MEEMKEKYENFKEQVRAQADIVRIISDYVPLKKKGGRYWGCCPFHGEKTPSFTVDEGKGLFHCFGCGVGGDVFSFIMKIENRSFPEAVKFLAGKLNIPIPEREKNPAEIARELQAREIYTANELAAKFFQSCLLNTEYGKTGVKYLADRGITREIIDSFALGMAPPDYNKLHLALEKKGVSTETMVRAGLANKRDSGGIYDRFRGRIMIPIRDVRGRVVGFTGRVLSKEAKEAKYMNTGETEWFSKRNILFGLDAALKSIKEHKQVILVEGHMDAISLHAAGINWAVAAMGTAFTEQHARLIKQLSPEVVFSFDSDKAGIEAAIRAVPIALHADLKNKVMQVPEGKDPDDFVRKHGKDAYIKLIDEAVEGLDFQINHQLEENAINTLAGKVQAVANILPFLLECKSDIEVAQRIRDLARALTIDEGLIQSEYNKLKRQDKKDDFVPRSVYLAPQTTTALEQAERHLLFALIKGRDVLTGNFVLQLQKVVFESVERTEIFKKTILFLQEGRENLATDLFEVLSENGASELTNILRMELPSTDLAEMLSDCLRQLRLAVLEQEFARHSSLAAEYEKQGNEKYLQELSECRRIKNEEKEIITLSNETKNKSI
jgi:DNA primase